MNYTDILIWLNSIKGVNNRVIDILLDYFGDLQAIWNTPDYVIKNMDIINDSVKYDILRTRNIEYISLLKNKISNKDIKVLTIYDKDYPYLLKKIYDPPKILYMKGNIKVEDNVSIAIVGTRKATPYGRWAAEKFTSELSGLGITLVSGMARGIDSIVHKTAIKENGRTIAVLGSGINVIYPKMNQSIYDEITGNGAVISEFPLDVKPFPQNFPQRNRIISGLCLGVIVIEAKEKSGSLITANHALEQGREVFAIPGNINSLYSKGTNKLIKDGAKLVMDIDDILEEISQLSQLCKNKDKDSMVSMSLNDEEKKVYNCITESPQHCDSICQKTAIDISRVSSILTLLEMKGLIKQLPGKLFTVK